MNVTVEGSVEVCLCRGPIGEPGEGIHLQRPVIVGGGIWKCNFSFYWSSVRETWRCKRLWRWAPLSMGALLGNLGEGSYAGDLCVEEGSGMGDLLRGVRLPGTLRDG